MSLKNESTVNDDGKNKKQITCVQCKSKILPPNMGTYVSVRNIRKSIFFYKSFIQLRHIKRFQDV